MSSKHRQDAAGDAAPGRAGLGHDSRLLNAPASASGPPEPWQFLEARPSALYGPEAPSSIGFSHDMKPAAYSEQGLKDLAVSLVYVGGLGPLAGRQLIREVAAVHAACDKTEAAAAAICLAQVHQRVAADCGSSFDAATKCTAASGTDVAAPGQTKVHCRQAKETFSKCVADLYGGKAPSAPRPA